MKPISIVLIVLFLIQVTSCKKSKLSSQQSNIDGCYKLIGDFDDGGSYELNLKERGKYKLYKGKLMVDHGRLLLENNHLIFHSDKIPKSYSKMNKQGIKTIENSNLIITRIGFVDSDYYFFERQ